MAGLQIRTKHKERRKLQRRAFAHYMRLMNEQTGELVGHMVDISISGFRLESLRPIPINADFPIRLEVPPDLASQGVMVFRARSRWSLPDRIDPTLYNAGFQIVDMNPEDGRVYGLLVDKYGSDGPTQASRPDYLWGR